MKGKKEDGDLKKTLRAVEKELALYKSIADSAHDWEMLTDNKQNIIYISPSFHKITGYNPSDFLRDLEFLHTIIHPEDKEFLIKHEKQIFQKTPRSESFNFRIISKNKKIKWINHNCSPLYNNKGVWVGQRSTNRDITEQKLAEIALRESEMKYRLLSEISTDDGSSLILQEDGSFLREWSIDTLSNKLGYTKHEIDSFDKWIKIVYPADQKKFIEGISSIKKGKNVSTQLRVVSKSGELRWIQNTIKTIKDPKTNVIRLLSAVKDITEFKITEQSLMDSEDKFRAILNTIDVGIVQSQGAGSFDIVNDAFVHMLGYSRDELKDLKFYDITPTEDLKKEFDAFNNAVKNKETGYVLEKCYVKRNGSLMLCRVTYHILYDENKSVRQVLSVVHDITEQRKIEFALIDSEKKYRSLAENTDDIICKCDSNYRVTFVNKAIQRFSHLKIKDYLGKRISEIKLPKEILRYIEDYLHIVFRTKKPTQTTIKINIHNVDVFFSCRLYPEFDDQNIVKSILCFCSDISELIKIEQELIKAKDKAEESDRLKSIFLANMSHEIRTPMNAIVGFATLLDNENLVAETRNKYVDIINSSAENLLTIINDILDISKIEAGLFEISDTAFNLHQVLEDTHTHFEMQKKIRNKDHIKFVLKNDCSIAYNLLSDEVRIQQLLNNLLSNALKFIEEGSIEFGYNEVMIMDKSYLQFYVKDTGIGIADDKKEIIFDRFRQEEESINSIHGGTGLGLSICKGILELMNGKIWVETNKGKGTIFYFTIPIKSTDPCEIKKENTGVKSEFIFKNKTILIIDDTPEIHHYLTEVLKKTGVHLLHALTATDALVLVDLHSQIDLILMDIRLPDINGLELTRLIKNKRDLPIIAQTAFALSGDRKKIMESGCDDYITKPIDRLLLLMCLSKYLNKNFN